MRFHTVYIQHDDELQECSVCCALVTPENTQPHADWHDELAQSIAKLFDQGPN